MHRALVVSDILVEIFAYFNPILHSLGSDERSFFQKCLAILGRTCKDFHEPAMDLLWADMEGITPILGCVPRLHSFTLGRRLHAFPLRNVKALSEDEAHPFLRYASRVRSLHLTTFCDQGFDLLTAIETCVFPNLLELDCGHSQNVKLWNSFISPSLRRCVLPRFHSDLEPIATRCPLLESLTICSAFSTDLSSLSDTVRSCKQLVFLCCPRLDFLAWNHLSDHPTLLTVMIHDRDILWPESMNWDHLCFTRFHNLTTLAFDIQWSADAIAIMRHSEFPSLKEFHISIALFPWEQAEQLFRALSPNKTLEHIEILSVHLSDMPTTMIRQFFGFQQLRTLQLVVGHPIYIDNDLLLEAMSSWPHIRSLELKGHLLNGHRPLSTVTFSGLFAALRMCPQLLILALPMDAVNIDIDPEAESFQHTSLRAFDVCRSYVEDPHAVARIVSSMLPFIKWIEFTHTDNPHPWIEVNRLLQESLPGTQTCGRHIANAAPMT